MNYSLALQRYCFPTIPDFQWSMFVTPEMIQHLAENENNKTRVLDYGADEFAIKPISPTTIVEKVSMLLMERPAEAQTV